MPKAAILSKSIKYAISGMARTEGAVGKKTLEYVIKYDQLVEQFGCPVEALFRLGFKARKQQMRFQALKELLSYRYPKQVAAKIEAEAPAQMHLAWELSDDEKPAPIDIDKYEVLENEPAP